MRCPWLCCDSTGEFLEIDIRYISENYNVVFHHQRKQMQLNTSETHTQNRLSGFEVLRGQRFFRTKKCQRAVPENLVWKDIFDSKILSLTKKLNLVFCSNSGKLYEIIKEGMARVLSPGKLFKYTSVLQYYIQSLLLGSSLNINQQHFPPARPDAVTLTWICWHSPALKFIKS